MEIYETLFTWNTPLANRKQTTLIVLHHAAASVCTVDDIDQWHKARGWAGIGYHFFVRKDGTVYRGRPANTVGAHVENYNNNSIGICAEGNYENEIMPEAQKKSLIELVGDLKALYTGAKIVGHNDLKSTLCPGKNYPLNEIKSLKADPAASASVNTPNSTDVQGNKSYAPAKLRVSPYAEKDINITVTSLYGSRNGSFHYGIDLVGKVGTAICSTENGTVQRAQYQDPGNSKVGYGLYVWVSNDSGTGCIYAHLSSVTVKPGDKVSAGQIIGYQGHTGSVRSATGGTGEHLHFGVSISSDYSTTHNSKSKYFFNPKNYFNTTFTKGASFKNDGTKFQNSDYTPPADSAQERESSSNSERQNFTQLEFSGEYYNVVGKVSGIQDILFGRRYRCIIDCGDEAFDVSDLRCKFSIVKSARVEVCSSSIAIYNLNPDTENKIIKAGKRIIIEAGYSGAQYGKIFSGNIIQPLRSKESNVDYVLTLVSMDSDAYVSYGLVGVALVANQSSRDAITNCINRAGEITDRNYEQSQGYICNTSITYPRGKVMFGKATQFLNQIAKSENATYYNEDGAVNIVKMSDYPTYEVIHLEPQSGLVGNPTQNADGINFSCLINPSIRINSFVHIDNRIIKNYQYQPGLPVRSLDDEGVYRVIKMQIVGDTRGSDNSWIMQCDAIAQSCLLPGMVAGADIYNY